MKERFLFKKVREPFAEEMWFVIPKNSKVVDKQKGVGRPGPQRTESLRRFGFSPVSLR
jgi:hypothetical protein